MKGKKKWVACILSSIFWGSGQIIIGKQVLKGSIFLGLQCLCLGIEIGSGYWIEYFAGMIEHFSIRLYGGVFTRGIWGLVTLGSVESQRSGDHSTMLLIRGIIVLMLLLILVCVYCYNVKDAFETGKKVEKYGKIESSNEFFKRIYANNFPYFVVIPIGLLISFVVVMPIIFAIATAFTNYNANHLPPGNLVSWVGLKNFKKLVEVPIWTSTFLAVLRWTIIWAVLATITTYFLGMFQAILLNSKEVKWKGLFRSIMILPWAIPQLISLFVFKNLLNGQFGPISKFLMDLGLVDHRIAFLSNPYFAKITILVVNLWLGFPMFMIMIQGILSNIDKSLYEAAQIDGANSLHIFKKITFPIILKATAPLIVMNFAGNFNGFGIIYFLTEGGPVNANYQFAGSTDILISWIYKLTLNQKLYDMAAVMNLIIFTFIGIVSIWNFRKTQAFKEVSE